MNASEAQLGRAERWYARGEWACATLVFLGVLGEVALAALHPPYDSPWNRWGSTIADAVIALGIVGEVIFGRLDARIIPVFAEPSKDACLTALNAALSAGIECFVGEAPSPMMSSTSGDDLTEPMADITVGAKPSATAPGPESIQALLARHNATSGTE